MDRMTLLFWTVITLLLGASTYFGISAESQRQSLHRASGKIESGDLLKLVKVIDGDTLLAAKDQEEPVTIRMVGIKSFESKVEKDVVAPFARAGIEEMEHAMADKPLRVLLNAVPKDKQDRYLATLYAEDEDIALHLIHQGLVVVYTVYPFPAMQIYLQEQQKARAERRGIWSSKAATERAQALMREWRSQSE